MEFQLVTRTSHFSKGSLLDVSLERESFQGLTSASTDGGMTWIGVFTWPSPGFLLCT